MKRSEIKHLLAAIEKPKELFTGLLAEKLVDFLTICME